MKKSLSPLIILIALALLIMCSCSSQKRLNRLLQKHPELSATKDTVIRDTILISNTQIDTVFKESKGDTTVIISNDSIVIKYIKIKDKIYLSGKTTYKPVIRERRITVKSPVITKTVMKDYWYHKLLIYWFILSLLYIGYRLILPLIESYLNRLPFKH